MKLGQVQRLVASATALAVFALPVVADASLGSDDFVAPSKKGKKAEEAAPEPEPEPEVAEPEPEPEVAEPEPEPDPVDEDAELDAAAAGDSSGGMKGRVGLGGTRSLSGNNGISLRYYVAPKLSIGALIGFATFSHREPDDNGDYTMINTVGLLGAGVQAFFWPVQGSREKYISADFGVGARGVVYVGFQQGDDNPDTLDRPLEIDIEVPLATNLFIGDSVAITPEFGFVARIVPGNREPDEQDNSDPNPGSGVGERLGTTNGPGLGFEFGNHAGVFFGLSITYFFGGDGAKKKSKSKKNKGK